MSARVENDVQKSKLMFEDTIECTLSTRVKGSKIFSISQCLMLTLRIWNQYRAQAPCFCDRDLKNNKIKTSGGILSQNSLVELVE